MLKDEIIILHTFKDIMEATLAVDQLKANSIESFLEDTRASGINPMGGVELKVFFKDKEEAGKIIEEFKN
jgi:Putative prokaryotic signal transducing protein